MKQYKVTGMHCAACSARVEKSVLKVHGVQKCSVNLLTGSMNIEGDAVESDIIKAVKKAGYGAEVNNGQQKAKDLLLTGKEAILLKKRFLYSLFYLLPLVYISMGHSMFNMPLPAFFSKNHIAAGVMQMILALIILLINKSFFINGFKSFINSAANMDTLVALGSGISFLKSLHTLFTIIFFHAAGNSMHLNYVHEFYFESSAMIVTLITLGKMLEAVSKGKTTDAVKKLINLTPKTALIIQDGKEILIPAEDVKAGDIFIVRAGESIPADGVIIEGEAAVNESALTGESIPADKAAQDFVYAASINQNGFIKCKAVHTGAETALAKIINLVMEASSAKAPIAKTADKVSGFFVPAVISIAVITFTIWLILEKDAAFAAARAISVLLISCPCALGLATPVAIMTGSGLGAKNAILFKTPEALEYAGKIQIAVFDKTGTITNGSPQVSAVVPAEGIEEKELLQIALNLESKSNHPLAKAVLKKAEALGMNADENIENFRITAGSGLSAVYKGEEILGGSVKYISSKKSLEEKTKELADKLSLEGKTPLLFLKNNNLLGIIAVSDSIKKDSAQAVKQLHDMGVRTVMLTGDNKNTAEAVAAEAGIQKVISDVMPEEKALIINKLKKLGMTAMIGDGINDAPALACADIGIAVGAGTDIAIDSADIILVNSRLTDVPVLINISRYTLNNILQNLFWAFFYNVVGIPLAAGAFIPFTGWELNPVFGAAAMSLSSFCVVTNALRLNFIKVKKDRYTKIIKNEADIEKLNKINLLEDEIMKKTMKVEGMMCSHCEASVKKILEGINGVKSADVSHKTGTAEITFSQEIDDSILKKAIEKENYKVTSIDKC